MPTRSALNFMVLALLVLQAVLTGLLWLIDTTGEAGADAFALVLSADLFAFATVAHFYRTSRRREDGAGS